LTAFCIINISKIFFKKRLDIHKNYKYKRKNNKKIGLTISGKLLFSQGGAGAGLWVGKIFNFMLDFFLKIII